MIFGSPGRIRTYSPSVKLRVLIEPLEADLQPHEREERVLCFGRTKSGRLLTILYTERRAVPLKIVTKRLPVSDIKTAQDLAHVKGYRYQTYIKTLLHEALKKERSA